MERETSLEERERHDQEKADENRERRERLGELSAPEPEPALAPASEPQ